MKVIGDELRVENVGDEDMESSDQHLGLVQVHKKIKLL